MISTAHAQSLFGGTGNEGIMGFLPIILMFVVMWFLMIRPQQKRAKELKAMLEALKTGDEVITAGGLLGKTIKVSGDFVTLEVASGVEMNVQKAAVTAILPKGTIKAI